MDSLSINSTENVTDSERSIMNIIFSKQALWILSVVGSIFLASHGKTQVNTSSIVKTSEFETCIKPQSSRIPFRGPS